MRGLISPTSQHCRENVLDTRSRRLDRGLDTAGSTLESRRRSSMQTALGLALLVAIVIAVVVGARYASRRRKRIEEAVILQSQLSDVVAREPQLHGLVITPRARVSGWRKSQVTVEVSGEVPTPELRETVMRIVGAEAWQRRPDIVTVDQLFIVPPVRRPSDSVA